MAGPTTVAAGPGREDAPVGSRDWCDRLRAEIRDQIGAIWFDGRSYGRRLDALVKHEAWRQMNRADGAFFSSLEEFCSYRQPWGLGMRPEDVTKYLAPVREGASFKSALSLPSAHPVHAIPLSSIERGGGTQVREKTDDGTVSEYATAYTDGAAFPPIVVFFDGERHWLADGFHRVAACEQAGLDQVLAEVREGSREDALWFALSANKQHGRPMSSADKRRAVKLLLSVEKWRGMSNAAIAKEIGIGDHLVAEVKKEVGCSTSSNARLNTKTEGADGKMRPTVKDASDKVRKAFDADPELKNKSAREIADSLGVSVGTVTRVRKAPTTATLTEPKRHPVLDELAKATAPTQAPTLAIDTDDEPEAPAETTPAPVTTPAPSAPDTAADTARLSSLTGALNRFIASVKPADAGTCAADLEALLRKWGAL